MRPIKVSFLVSPEFKADLPLLLFAGYETTVHLIASGTLALLQHPEERARFAQDASLAERAIEELLRYTSPLDMTTRLMKAPQNRQDGR